MRALTFILLAFAASSACAQRYEAPPLVGFISIHTTFSKLPSIYIDEWGNARIATYCNAPTNPHLDIKLGKAAFEKAVQTLTDIEFHTIPYQPNYEYILIDGKKVLSLQQSSHEAKYHVTFNEQGPWNMHTVLFDRSKPSKEIEAIESLIAQLVQDHRSKLCGNEN